MTAMTESLGTLGFSSCGCCPQAAPGTASRTVSARRASMRQTLESAGSLTTIPLHRSGSGDDESVAAGRFPGRNPAVFAGIRLAPARRMFAFVVVCLLAMPAQVSQPDPARAGWEAIQRGDGEKAAAA